jgi:hypothetical protein
MIGIRDLDDGWSRKCGQFTIATKLDCPLSRSCVEEQRITEGFRLGAVDLLCLKDSHFS